MREGAIKLESCFITKVLDFLVSFGLWKVSSSSSSSSSSRWPWPAQPCVWQVLTEDSKHFICLVNATLLTSGVLFGNLEDIVITF